MKSRASPRSSTSPWCSSPTISRKRSISEIASSRLPPIRAVSPIRSMSAWRGHAISSPPARIRYSSPTATISSSSSSSIEMAASGSGSVAARSDGRAGRLLVGRHVEGPFGEYLGREFVRARFPLGGHDIFIGRIFEGTADRALEVPEAGGRDIMPAGSSLGFPATLGDELAAADHLVHIAHLEGDMIEMALPIHGVEQEEMMVVARGRAAQEHRAAGITVGDTEAEALHVEILDRFHVGHADDDVADLLRRGALVISGRLVDSAGRSGRVETERLDLELDALGKAESNRVAGIVDGVEGTVAFAADIAIARELLTDGVERALAV